MKAIKSLLLGAAAGLAATAGVQAADMPVKAKAVEYVKICSAYGAGFYYIPGTDICLRLGGAVRADYYHHAVGAFPNIGYDVSGTRSEESHAFRGRGYFILDSRQNTAYGTLRTYANIYQSWTTGSGGLGAGEGTNADRAFIQFAGFTFGRAQSFFDFYGSTGPIANIVNWGGQGTGASGWNVLAYTAQFGNGLSGTVAIEDQRRKPIYSDAAVLTDFGTATAIAGSANLRAGQQMPAVTANLRVDQAWGSAQIMGAIQELRTLSNNEVAAIPGGGQKTTGYAFGGGFTWNNPSAPGSQFGIQAAYAKGALGYIQTGSTSPTYGVLSNATLAYAHVMDAVYDVSTDTLHKGEGWGVNAGYQHRFNPNWAWSIHGAYTSIEYGAAAAFAVGGAGTTLDFDVWSLGSRLLWTPVPGLNMGLDVMYHEFDSQSLPTGLVKTVTSGSEGHWSSMFRVQRDF
jgi:hypothetical protein